MQMSIHCTDFKLSKVLEAKIQRKLEFTLNRVAPYIRKISITINNANTKAAAVSTYCQMTLAMTNQEEIVIEDTQMDVERVIDRVLQKASRTIERMISANE